MNRELAAVDPVQETPLVSAVNDQDQAREEATAQEAHSSVIHMIWRGGKQARVAIPRPRFIEDVPDASDPAPDDPGNIVIEGDNCQAMVSLLAQYGSRVDVCLTDPPYNTGKRDFRYSDARFADPDADDTSGDFVSAEDGGRHGKWLNQMAPTFRIIRELLAPHGLLMVHINDIELPRLLMLLEEIFDERNNLGTIVWKNATDNNPTRITVEHEYIVVFAKDKEHVAKVWKSPAAETRDLMLGQFAKMQAEGLTGAALATAWRRFVLRNRAELGEFGHYILADEDGPYTAMRALHNPGKEGYHHALIHPNGKVTEEPLRGYRYPGVRLEELKAAGRIIFGKDETELAKLKVYLRDADVSLKSVVEIDGRTAATEVAELFDGDVNVFKNPKPVEIEEYLLSFVAPKTAIVLDPFGGSGTTGHAVMRLNARDGGRRRFILIEEGNEGDAYATSLTADRLRRARLKGGLPGGFTFKRVGERIDMENFTRMQRAQLVEAVVQTDASGRGGGIRRVEGAKHVIAKNARGEAICLHYDPDGHSPVTSEVLREMYLEAKSLGLSKPLRVYGERSEVFGSDSFRFFKIPDEVADNLVMSLRGPR